MSRLIFVAILFTSASLIAAEPGKRPVTVDDYFTLGMLNEVAISPDGEFVAYTEGRWLESANNRRTDLWLVSSAGGEPQRLTFDRAGYDSLHWSLDGQSLYFAAGIQRAESSNPPFDGSRQVWQLVINRRELIPVTRVDDGIENFDLSANQEWLIYTKSDTDDNDPWAALRAEHSRITYGTRKRVLTSFYKLNLKTWRTTFVTKYTGAVDEFDISSDGTRLAMITGEDAEVITLEGSSQLTILDLEAGNAVDLPDDEWRKPKMESPYGRLTEPKWSADGELLAFSCGFDAYPSQVYVASWEAVKKPVIRRISMPDQVSFHGGVDGAGLLVWRGRSHDLCFLGDDRARVRIYCAQNVEADNPKIESLTSGDVVVDLFAWDANGARAAAIIGSSDRMHDVSVFDGKDWMQVTEIHAHTQAWALPKISIVKWKGAGDVPVEGILELPADYNRDKPLPLIVNLHGGPTAAWPCFMQYGFTGSVLFAGQGYAYFSPNYRGSTGYGDKFITDLVGHENEIELVDILRGVDELIDQGIADRERIAVTGWSNGGYLTNCLIAHTDRFRAASSGAGIMDMTLEWGTNDEPAFPVVFLSGTPWEAPKSYRRTSPIFHFGKVKTPTLFHVGEKDLRCPKGQSEMAFRALKEYLKVDSELLIYPNEAHGLSAYSSRKAKMVWDLAWFDHYLKGKPKP